MINYKLTMAFLSYLVALCVNMGIDTRISDAHNINQCDPITATVNLFESNLYAPAEFLDFVYRNVTYPESGSNSHKITCLKVIDMDTSDHGGYPELISGGVGWYDVQISISSQWNQPLNFRIEIWADE